MYRHNGKVPRDRNDVDAKIVKSINIDMDIGKFMLY